MEEKMGYRTQWTQITTDLQEFENSKTNTQPAIAVGGFAGSPSYIFAWKGPNSTDEIHLSGVAPISGASTDAAPALAVLNSYLVSRLYLAWKVGKTVKVRQYVLTEDGFPVVGRWEELPTTHGRSSEPAVATDATPALAAGVDNNLYMVWKTPGPDALLAWSAYDGSGWSAPDTIPLAKTSTNPALVGWFSRGEAAVIFCLAWKGANTDDVFWSSFTPGSSSFTQNHVPGASTDAAPALTTGYVGGSYIPYVVWKDKGDGLLSFAPLSGKTAGVTTTMMQAGTNAGPAAANWSNYDPSDPEETFNYLILAWKGTKTDNVWSGSFSVLPDPAPLRPNTRPHTLGSSCNYVMSTNGAHITALSLTIEVTQEIVSDNGFGFQLNCYTTQNEYSAWQQYILCYDPSQAFQFAGQVDNWTTTAEILNSGLSWFCPIEGATPAGTVLGIALSFDSSSQKVIGAKFTATLPGKPESSLTLKLKDLLTDAGPKESLSRMSPIVAFEFCFVGKDGSTAVLTSGAGTITYTASPALTAGEGFPGFIEYTEATGEQANSGYSQLPAGSSETFTQSFVTVPTVGWWLS
jgi:hypothetical protein